MDELIARQVQHLKRPQMSKRLGMDGGDPVILQVEFPQVLQRFKLESRQLGKLITIQMEYQESFESTESVV